MPRTPRGKRIARAVVKTIGRAARAAGIDPTGLATHAGRRTVVTALYADGGLDLADIARHVGHVDTTTTAGHVRSLGSRPRDTALRAAELLDPTIDVQRSNASSAETATVAKSAGRASSRKPSDV